MAGNDDTIPKLYLAKYAEDVQPASTQDKVWR
jgi:hypothetical protein